MEEPAAAAAAAAAATLALAEPARGEDEELRCRLCLGNWSRDEEPGRWAHLGEELAQKLLAIAAVQIEENDGLPTTVCTNCRDLVCMSYDFKCQVERSDHDLRQALLAKQSTLNTKWPTVSIEKPHESASTVEVVVPCLQNNIINSNMTIQENYTTNNSEQFTFKITTGDVNSESFKSSNLMQQSSLVESQIMITNDNMLSFQIDNTILESQNSLQNLTFQQQEYENEKNKSNESTSFNTESKSTEENSYLSEDEKPLILRTKRHKCNYCIKSFANLSLLEKHAVIHKQTKVYICYVCDQEFTSVDAVKSHATEIHDLSVDKEKITNHSKTTKVNSVLRTENGSKSNSNFTCKLCNRIFSCHKLLLSHMKCHSNNRYKLLNDDALVGEAARHPTNSGAASQLAYTEAASYSANSEAACHLADLKTASYPENAEVATQTNANPSSQDNSCKVPNNSHKSLEESGSCDGSFNDKENNDDNSDYDNDDDYDDVDDEEDDDDSHGDDNSQEANIQCNECGILVATQRNLKRHLLTHSGQKYKCSVCRKDFSRPDKLKEHQLLKHKQEIFGKSDSDDSNDKNEPHNHKKDKNYRPYKCNLCPKAFVQAQSLTNHQEKHTRNREVRKRYLCEVCSKCFAQSGSLKAHMRTHTGVKPYVCNVCNRAFTKSTYLQLHLRTHSGEKPYICQYCSKAFARANTLARHITMHTGEAKYKCQICSKYFRRLTSLNEHMYTHTGQRPYACKICTKRYNNAGSLYAHTKKCKTTVEANVNATNETNNEISFQPPDNTLVTLNDNNIASQILIFTDKKLDDLISDEAILADTQTCQFMIANMPSQRPVSMNMLEQFTIQDSDIYTINSRQFKTPYYGLYPNM